MKELSTDTKCESGERARGMFSPSHRLCEKARVFVHVEKSVIVCVCVCFCASCAEQQQQRDHDYHRRGISLIYFQSLSRVSAALSSSSTPNHHVQSYLS